MSLPTLKNKLMKKIQCTTMYKNNSGLSAESQASNYKKGLCSTEKTSYS